MSERGECVTYRDRGVIDVKVDTQDRELDEDVSLWVWKNKIHRVSQ